MNKFRRDGYTLIEMLVVIGIMGILMAMGVASYNTLNDRAQVEQTARNLATKFRDWQKQADSGSSSAKCNGLIYGGMRVSLSGSQFQANMVCGATLIPVETYDLLHTVIISDFTEVTFLPLAKGVTVDSGNSEVFTLRAGSISYRITIESGGGISVVKLS